VVIKTDFDFYWSIRLSGHNDLIIRFDEEYFVCDSHYFKSFLISKNDRERSPQDLFRDMCVRFVKQIRKLGDSDWTLHLPVDLSDQGTGWLRFDNINNGVSIEYVFGGRQGWMFNFDLSPFPETIDQHDDSVMASGYLPKDFLILHLSRLAGLDS
jgi:hypothetical protein